MSEQPRAPRIEVWQEPNGEWQWRYLGVAEVDGEPLELEANEPESSREEAVSAARLAYPDTPIEVLERSPVDDPQAPPRRWLWPAVTGALASGLAVVAVRYRRWWLVPVAPFVAAGVVARVRRSLP